MPEDEEFQEFDKIMEAFLTLEGHGSSSSASASGQPALVDGEVGQEDQPAGKRAKKAKQEKKEKKEASTDKKALQMITLLTELDMKLSSHIVRIDRTNLSAPICDEMAGSITDSLPKPHQPN